MTTVEERKGDIDESRGEREILTGVKREREILTKVNERQGEIER